MEENGLTDLVLIKQIKKELKAHVTKTQKLRGAVTPNELKKGIRTLSVSGQIVTTREGEVYGDGDTVIAWNEVDWATRQRARMDAHKLRGDYPAERQEISYPDQIQYTPEERKLFKDLAVQQARKELAELKK
jgi:hypothetical protein